MSFLKAKRSADGHWDKGDALLNNRRIGKPPVPIMSFQNCKRLAMGLGELAGTVRGGTGMGYVLARQPSFELQTRLEAKELEYGYRQKVKLM